MIDLTITDALSSFDTLNTMYWTMITLITLITLMGNYSKPIVEVEAVWNESFGTRTLTLGEQTAASKLMRAQAQELLDHLEMKYNPIVCEEGPVVPARGRQILKGFQAMQMIQAVQAPVVEAVATLVQKDHEQALFAFLRSTTKTDQYVRLAVKQADHMWRLPQVDQQDGCWY